MDELSHDITLTWSFNSRPGNGLPAVNKKKNPVRNFGRSCAFRYEPMLPFGLEAVPAINRFFTAGLKRNHRLHTATEADGRIHLTFPMAAVIPLLLSSVSTTWTTSRFIFKSFGSVKLLLARSKGEGLPAVLTGQGFVSVHVNPPEI
jgi:hypothetical protein